MLTIIGTKERAVGTLSIDSTIPFSFRADRPSHGDTLTWRYRDGENGLLEFKIDRDSGVVYGVTLVNSRQRFEVVADLPCSILPPEPGLPVVKADAVFGDVIDQRMTVKLVRSQDGICALWGQWGAATDCFSVDRVRFLISDDVLVGICFVSITESESRDIDEWDKYRNLAPPDISPAPA